MKHSNISLFTVAETQMSLIHALLLKSNVI